MSTWRLRISDVVKDRILVSRESARLLEGPIRDLVAGGSAPAAEDDSATIDFAGVEGVAPSFLDELLSVLEEVVGAKASQVPRRLRVVNPPTRLSLKFEAVARGHALIVTETEDGGWLLTSAAKPSN